MKLAKIDSGPGRPGNAAAVFVALDDAGQYAGKCVVIPYIAQSLLPDCPFNIYLDIDGRMSAMDLLLGAGLAAAQALHRQYPRLDARVYTGCHPNATNFIRLLHDYNFNVDDGEEGMSKRLDPTKPADITLPQGMSWISDKLESPMDSEKTLERINSTFADERDMAWLNKIKTNPDFRRYAVIDIEGTVGEILVYRGDNTAGIIPMIIVDPHARNLGVAHFLLECARVHFLSLGLSFARADVWARLKPAQRLFISNGFEYTKDAWLYPGFTMYRRGQ